jgi:hypothetical protein
MKRATSCTVIGSWQWATRKARNLLADTSARIHRTDLVEPPTAHQQLCRLECSSNFDQTKGRFWRATGCQEAITVTASVIVRRPPASDSLKR